MSENNTPDTHVADMIDRLQAQQDGMPDNYKGIEHAIDNLDPELRELLQAYIQATGWRLQ